MIDIRAFVNGRLKFSICVLIAAKFKYCFSTGFKVLTDIMKTGGERSKFSVTSCGSQFKVFHIHFQGRERDVKCRSSNGIEVTIYFMRNSLVKHCFLDRKRRVFGSRLLVCFPWRVYRTWLKTQTWTPCNGHVQDALMKFFDWKSMAQT
jgi:hypothetical protein